MPSMIMSTMNLSCHATSPVLGCQIHHPSIPSIAMPNPTILLLAFINSVFWILIFCLYLMDRAINAPPFGWIRRVAIDVGAEALQDAAIHAAEGYVMSCHPFHLNFFLTSFRAELRLGMAIEGAWEVYHHGELLLVGKLQVDGEMEIQPRSL